MYKDSIQHITGQHDSFDYVHAGRLGDDLQRRAWEQTESLKPPHLFVPWVVVNGIPLAYDYENVQKYICAAYYGFDR